MDKEANMIVVRDRIGYTILYLVLFLLMFVYIILFIKYVSIYGLIFLPLVMTTLILLLASIMNKLICEEDKEYIDNYILFMKKRIYYQQMSYFVLKEEGNTITMVVYSKDDKKLFKVNMLAKTNTSEFSNVLYNKGIHAKKED